MEGQNNSYQNDSGFTENSSYQSSYQQEPPKQTNALAIVGMILGILSLLLGCCGWYSLLLGIPGLICSILSRKNGKTGMAVAGIICSVIGIVISIAVTVMASILLIMVQDEMFMLDGLERLY